MNYNFKQKIIDNLIVFMLLMSAGGLLFVFNRNLSYLVFFIILGIAFLFFGGKLIKSKVHAAIITFLVLGLLFFLSYIFAVKEQSDKEYLYYLMVVFCSGLTYLFFSNNRSNEIFIERIYLVLKVIVFHSLFNFLAFFIIGNNLTLITSTYHECETFFNIFFYTTERGMMTLFGVEFCRNQGLFWEPGVLQGFLNIFFFLEAFIFKRNRWLLFLVSFLIITTYSTTGLAILLLQGGIFIYSEFKGNKVLLPLMGLLIIPIYMVFSINIDAKVQGEKEASFQKRLFDLIQPLFIASEHPLKGIGLDSDQFQKIRTEFHFSSNILQVLKDQVGVISTVKGTDKGCTNSITFLFAAMGFPTGILFLVMLFKQNIVNEKKKLFFLIVSLSVMSEPLLFRPFFFIFIISGFAHIFYKITSHKKQLA